MRVFIFIVLGSLLLATPLSADQQTEEDCVSPDDLHHVNFVQDNPDSTGYRLNIGTGRQDGPWFSKPTNGYANSLEGLTSPDNFKCAWSPDSNFVAIFMRDTKSSGDTLLCAVSNEKIQEITFPDLMPRLRRHLTAELRSMYVRPELWLPNHRLLLSVTGSERDEEHGVFRFILALQLRQNKAGHFTARIVSFQQDRSILFSIP